MERGQTNQLIAFAIKECTSAHEQRIDTGLSYSRKDFIDFLFSASFEKDDLLSARANCRLYCAALSLKCRSGWVLKDRDGLGFGNQLRNNASRLPVIGIS